MPQNSHFIWLLILIAGLISFILRASPYILFRGKNLNHPAFRFFDYAAYAVIGGIISMSLQKHAQVMATDHTLLQWQFICLFSAVVSFASYFYLKKPILCTILGIVTYQIAHLLIL